MAEWLNGKNIFKRGIGSHTILIVKTTTSATLPLIVWSVANAVISAKPIDFTYEEWVEIGKTIRIFREDRLAGGGGLVALTTTFW